MAALFLLYQQLSFCTSSAFYFSTGVGFFSPATLQKEKRQSSSAHCIFACYQMVHSISLFVAFILGPSLSITVEKWRRFNFN